MHVNGLFLLGADDLATAKHTRLCQAPQATQLAFTTRTFVPHFIALTIALLVKLT